MHVGRVFDSFFDHRITKSGPEDRKGTDCPELDMD
jgi:hypothetical protein